MAFEGGIKRSHISATPPPPRTLNVQKFAESRAPELESLHSIVASRLNNDFRSQRNKRRRTTGHDNRSSKNRWRKKQKFINNNDEASSALGKDQKKVPRRVLRRIGLRSNPATGFCISGDGTKRLRTHLWHAKRFTMTKRWGFYLPSRLQGRGRGSRALLRWFKHGVLVHDASYMCALQLEGPEDSLLSILRMVMVPTPSVRLEELSNSILSGVSYGSAMLHHVGIPSSQLIAPVTYMWRPLVRNDIEFESEKVLTCAHSSTTNSIACSSPFRQVWLWIHAAAFSEGCEALRCASNEQMAVTGISVSCIPLDGRLAKLEVIGSKAIQILQKILHPVSETSEASFQLKKCSAVEGIIETQLQKSYILEHAEHLPFGAILSLIVKDPRNLPKMEIEGVSTEPSTDQVDNVPQNEATGASTLTACLCPGKEKEIISSLWSEPEVDSVLLSGNKDLWDIQNVLNAPVEENLLCRQKHQKSMAYFCLHNTDSWLSTSENAEESSNSCPILLLKDSCPSGSSVRWSVILPLSWAKAFWIPLVSHGAHAIGFREKQQIACDVGLPSFPFDFPDCMSYSISMAEEAAASDKKDELRPPSMRPLRVPIPPPWSSVGSFEEFPEVRDNESKIGSTEVGPASSLEDSVDQDSACLGGFVVRTSIALSNYLNEVHGNHLLLFLNATEREKGFSEFSKDECNPSRVPIGILDDRKLSFLRVHLHAYKEGVFELGAVVCAPRLSDISLWISRSDKQEGGLLIPQSSIGSYFVQLPCGKWELQKPEDPVARESYRFPIGFVTTGFVSGSTKPVAEAFCAATQLSRLRGEQWEGLQRKRAQEIFVLVRNLRSAAYRLALATIVLEQQEEDIEFM